MYGAYTIPLSVREDGFRLSLERKEGTVQYVREVGEDRVEKFVLAKHCSVLINPVEPLHTPRDLTPYLLVEFEKKLIVEPKGSSRVYLTFPAEIGIFAARRGKSAKDFQVIDIFSLDSGKYSLYGDIRTGILCKHHKSDVFMSPPTLTPFVEGIMELTIANKIDRWVEVSRAVFNAYLMKIYHSKDKIGMKALMTLVDKDTAETSFSDSPLEKGMNKAVEHYVARGIIITASSFLMEWGYDAQ